MQHKQIERLLLFLAVAEQLSFAKAAEQLGISKGYLSDQIKTLEQDYQTPLLVRTTRSVRLTSEGQKALESAREIQYLANNLQRNLHRLDGSIRITAPKLFTEVFLTQLITDFRALHPQVKFEVNTSYNRFDLNQTHFDMAFRATRTPPENMVAQKLFSYKHVVAASPEYLQNSEKINEPSDLVTQYCLTSESQIDWPFVNGGQAVTGHLVSNDNQLLKQLALKHQGILRLPDYFLKAELEQKQLLPLLEEYKTAGLDIYLIYPTTTRETARLRQFTQFVTDYFKAL